MKYLQVPKQHRKAVKELAYKLQPNIWESYAGCTKDHKKRMDGLRVKCLDLASEELEHII